MLKLYFKTPLIGRIICGFILGSIIGIIFSICNNDEILWIDKTIIFIQPFGDVLIAMLKMVVIPIIFFSLVTGASHLPTKKFGKLGILVCLWYFFTSVFATIFGCLMATVLNPTMDNVEKITESQMSNVLSMRASGAGEGTFASFVTSLFQNPFSALSNGNFLPIIVFSILFGLAIRIVLDKEYETTHKSDNSVARLVEMFDACQKACFKLIEWILEYFPIGVLSLTICSFTNYGAALLGPYAKIATCVIICVLSMIFIIYPIFIFVTLQENPYKFMWKIREPIISAFLTRSSAATLPISIQTAEKLGINSNLYSFSLPLGATVNMDGVCVHLPVFAILAVNIFGLPMTPEQMGIVVLSIVFASIGAGGIPGGSVFLLFMLLSNMGLSPEQISLVTALALGINPLLDMFETACNIAGDNVCTYIIANKAGMIDSPNESGCEE